MLVYYKESKLVLISVLLIILDGILTLLIPSYFNHLNYFYPMLTISLIPFIYVLSKKNFLILILIMGVIYDLFYSTIIFYHVIIFLLLVLVDKKIIQYIRPNLWLFIILVIINIVVYDTISFSLIVLTNYSTVTINDLIYKISHSLILNILSVFVFYFLFR